MEPARARAHGVGVGRERLSDVDVLVGVVRKQAAEACHSGGVGLAAQDVQAPQALAAGIGVAYEDAVADQEEVTPERGGKHRGPQRARAHEGYGHEAERPAGAVVHVEREAGRQRGRQGGCREGVGEHRRALEVCPHGEGVVAQAHVRTAFVATAPRRPPSTKPW